MSWPGTMESVQITRAERDAAVSRWLLAAALNQQVGRREWAEHGVALLACGGIMSAVRIPGVLVYAAAGGEEPAVVDPYLRRALGGPVFMDIYTQIYYVLVPASAALRWPTEEFIGIDCLSEGCYLGVPAVDRTEPGPRSRAYWCVPMGFPAQLCAPAAVADLVRTGLRIRNPEEAKR